MWSAGLRRLTAGAAGCGAALGCQLGGGESCAADQPRTPTLVAVGNPMVDVAVPVSLEQLAALGLEPDSEAPLRYRKDPAAAQRVISAYWQPDKGTPGGAAVNSLRVAAWFAKQAAGQPLRCTALGCVGADAEAAVLRAACAAAGVEARFAVEPAAPTGRCIAFVLPDGRRSLLAVTGASRQYSPANAGDSVQVADSATVAYATSFVLTNPNRSAVVHDVASRACKSGGIFALNLSSENLQCMDPVAEQMPGLLAQSSLLFGNAQELQVFCQKQRLPCATLEEAAVAAAALLSPRAPPGADAGLAVITDGLNPTIVADSRGARRYPVPAVDKAAVVDTNGCGDSFVGGFLAAAAIGRGLDDCIRAGHWAAGQIVRQCGCACPTPPLPPQFEWG